MGTAEAKEAIELFNSLASISEDELKKIESRTKEHPAVTAVLALECPGVSVTIDEDGDTYMEICWRDGRLGICVGASKHDTGWHWTPKPGDLPHYVPLSSGGNLAGLMPVFTALAKKRDAAHEELEKHWIPWPPPSMTTVRADNRRLIDEVRRLRSLLGVQA